MTPKFSAREAIKFSWTKVMADPWRFIGLFVVSMVIQYIPVFFQNIPVLNILIQIACVILVLIFYMGITRIAIGVVDGKSFNVMDVFRADTKTFLQYLGTGIVFTIIIVCGFLLLIVPGFIWMYKYFFSAYLVIDKNMKVMDAIKESGRITEGNKMKLLQLSFLIFCINILGFLCLIVGVVITSAMSWVALAYAYRKLVPVTPVAV